MVMKLGNKTATFEDWKLGDWWALGIVIYFIFYGIQPYELLEYKETGRSWEGRDYIDLFFKQVQKNGLNDSETINAFLLEKLETIESEHDDTLKHRLNAITKRLMLPPADKKWQELEALCKLLYSE